MDEDHFNFAPPPLPEGFGVTSHREAEKLVPTQRTGAGELRPRTAVSSPDVPALNHCRASNHAQLNRLEAAPHGLAARVWRRTSGALNFLAPQGQRELTPRFARLLILAHDGKLDRGQGRGVRLDRSWAKSVLSCPSPSFRIALSPASIT